jgi:glycerol-3-phosphate acyltransferase PlsY
VSDVLSLLFIALGYLIGAVPTGLWVARARGVDIRSVGSGNIGATNVLRSLGIAPAVLVALADPVKGAVATALPLLAGQPEWAIAAAGLATVLGNDFNAFLGFRGGKGIATTTGVFLVVNPAVALTSLILGVATIALGRLVSLGSMVAILSAPLMLLLVVDGYPPSDLVLALALCSVGVFQHRENLRRLAKGSERRLGDPARPR